MLTYLSALAQVWTGGLEGGVGCQEEWEDSQDGRRSLLRGECGGQPSSSGSRGPN